MLGGSVLLFALVVGLLAAAYLRPGLFACTRPGHWLIGGGLVLPLPVLVLLTGTALVLGEQLLPHGPAPVRVAVEAYRWDWRFSYPDAPGAAVPDGALHIPAGVPVDVVVTSADVIHSFWVPRLAGKIDAIPGHTNTIRIQADRPGVYWGVCAEYCGVGHDVMTFQVEAHAIDDYALLMEPVR